MGKYFRRMEGSPRRLFGPSLLTLAFLCGVGTLALGDVVFLKGGQRLEGEVQEKGAGLEIKNEYGSWTVSKDDVVKIVRSVERLEAEGEELHAKARALYDEALALQDNVKAANAKLKEGLEYLRKIVDLYTAALDDNPDPRYGRFQKDVLTILQERRLYRDKMHSEIAADPTPSKAAPVTPATKPDSPTPAGPRVFDRTALLSKALAGDLEAQYALGLDSELKKWDSEEGLKWFQAAAEKGHPRSADGLGALYLLGKGVKQDFKEAQKWFIKAEVAGVPIARYHLGLMEWSGALGQRSIEKAYTWCEKALDGLWAEADRGDPEAKIALGWMFLEGIGRPPDLAKSLELYKQAAEQGYGPAQTALGVLHRDGKGVAKDRSLALEYFQKAAEQGFAESQVFLGELYDEYTGHKNEGEKDFKLAQQWYEKAAAQGHGRGLYRLGLIHLDGKGVPKNPVESVHLIQGAIKRGTDDFLKNALNDMGYLYERGLGVKVDSVESLKYYRLAADLGSGEAQYNLGTISLEKRNEKDAYKWYVMAAKGGNALAQNNLGTFYATGRVVRKNLDEASKWFLMAAQQGDPSAAENVKRLQKERSGK